MQRKGQDKKTALFEEAVGRVRDAGFPVQINPATGNALVDLDGNEGTYRLVLKALPDPVEPRSLHLQTILMEPSPAELGVFRDTLLEWLNAKNSDIIFGRYYVTDNYNVLVFEVALPVIEGKCDWNTFDEYLRLAAFSVEDALAQLKAVAKAE